MKKAGYEIGDFDLIEANEAFAAQSVAVAHDLGFNNDILNVNGGAIALIVICILIVVGIIAGAILGRQAVYKKKLAQEQEQQNDFETDEKSSEESSYSDENTEN